MEFFNNNIINIKRTRGGARTRTRVEVNDNRSSEKWLERELRRRVEKIGGLCIKFSSASEIGYPDRIVIAPRGQHIWVEIKSRGKKPRPVQQYRHNQLRAMGVDVRVIDREEQIDILINDIYSA